MSNKLSILDKLLFVPLSLNIFVNPRGMFLSVFPDLEGIEDLEEGSQIVDAKRFASLRDMEKFIEANVDEWVKQAEAIGAKVQDL